MGTDGTRLAAEGHASPLESLLVGVGRQGGKAVGSIDHPEGIRSHDADPSALDDLLQHLLDLGALLTRLGEALGEDDNGLDSLLCALVYDVGNGGRGRDHGGQIDRPGHVQDTGVDARAEDFPVGRGVRVDRVDRAGKAEVPHVPDHPVGGPRYFTKGADGSYGPGFEKRFQIGFVSPAHEGISHPLVQGKENLNRASWRARPARGHPASPSRGGPGRRGPAEDSTPSTSSPCPAGSLRPLPP